MDKFISIIGERAKRVRHYLGCIQIEDIAICNVYTCIWMYVKHISSTGSRSKELTTIW